MNPNDRITELRLALTEIRARVRPCPIFAVRRSCGHGACVALGIAIKALEADEEAARG